nr:hypothetical protein [Oceanococcus sp. HetDA_MAG_MS8]
MTDMIQTLEDLLTTAELSRTERDSVEQALDEGYEALDDRHKSCIRRLLNSTAAGQHRPGSVLARYRQRRAQQLASPRTVAH